MNALRIASRTVVRAPLAKRTFVSASVARADIVTDLYLKQVKEYKPAPSKASDSEGQVKQWSVPAPPAAPQSLGDVQSELSAYEASEAGGEAADAASSGGKAAKSDEGDWFELDTAPDHVHH